MCPNNISQKRARMFFICNGKIIFSGFSLEMYLLDTSTYFPSNNFAVKTNAQQKLKNYDRNLPVLRSKFVPTNFRIVPSGLWCDQIVMQVQACSASSFIELRKIVKRVKVRK